MFNNNDYSDDPYYRNYGLSYYNEPWRSMRKEMRRFGPDFDRDFGGRSYDRDWNRSYGRDYDRDFGGRSYDRDFGRDWSRSLTDRSDRSWDRSFDRDYDRDFGRDWTRSLTDRSDRSWDRSLLPSSSEFGLGLGSGLKNFFSPKIDISENDSNLIIHAEIPGLSKDQIKIDVDPQNRLHIYGDKQSKFEDKNSRYHKLETSYGSFKRVLQLPEKIDKNLIQAVYENGMLNITVPLGKDALQNRSVSITDRNTIPSSQQQQQSSLQGQGIQSSLQSGLGKEQIPGQNNYQQPTYQKDQYSTIQQQQQPIYNK